MHFFVHLKERILLFNYCSAVVLDIALAMFSVLILKIYFEIFFTEKENNT